MGMIRLLLAVSVVFAHMNLAHWLVGGRMAVQPFYLISGYLISYILVGKSSYSDLRKFYLNRALRIYPVYFVVIAAVLAVGAVLGVGAIGKPISELDLGAQIYLWVVNFTIIGLEGITFVEPLNHLWVYLLDPPAWTLALELMFYLVAPFIIRRRAVLIGVLVASLAARIVGWLVLGLDKDPWTYRFFPFEIALFLLGALSHQVLAPRLAHLAEGRWPTFATAAGILLLVTYPLTSWAPEPLRSIVYLGTIAGLLPLLFMFQTGRPWDVWLGNLSYPVYICHWPIVTRLYFLDQAYFYHSLIKIAFIVGVTLAVAIALERFISQPIERYRRRVRDAGAPNVAAPAS